jgi:hypothetical protein
MRGTGLFARFDRPLWSFDDVPAFTLFVAVLGLGCIPAARPGVVAHLASSPWAAREVGCLDLRVASGHDRLVPDGWPLLVADFSNRCHGRAEVHFEAVTVRAQAADGSHVPLAVFDPHHEIHPAWIEPRGAGAEAIELDAPSAEAGKAVASFCVDLSRVSPSATAAAPVCFRREGEAFIPDERAAPGPVVSADEHSPAFGAAEVSDVVGYRRRTRFGAGWEEGHTGDPSPMTSTGVLRFATYEVGSLLTIPAESREVGCLEVQVEGRAAPGLPRSVDVRLRFGNRCHRALPLDFRAVRSVARTPDGSEHAMSLYDPVTELHVFELDARYDGVIALQYDAPEGTPAGSGVCVDVSRLVVGEPAAGVTPVCFERVPPASSDDDVVGHQPYAPANIAFREHPWRVFAELGVSTQLVDFGGTHLSGTLADGRHFEVPGSTFGRTATYALDFRFGPFLGGPFYAGIWLRTGFAYFGGLPVVDGGGGIQLKPDVGIVDLTGGGVAGIAFARSPVLRLRGEIAAGARVFEMDMAPFGCAVGDNGCTRSAWLVQPDLEPRLALDSWINPWWSIGGWVSADVLHLPGVGGGIAITLHSRGYDGVR